MRADFCTEVIQPLIANVVNTVLVKDGDRVLAAQVLVELDATMATADIAGMQEQLKTQVSDLLRTQEMLRCYQNRSYKRAHSMREWPI